MIFNNNSTALGAMDIPVAEGYDFQTGTAMALIESARNDYAMFKAMLAVDSKECQIQRESANIEGYVTEGEITSLAEAAAGGIWSKIVALFKKLIAKVKAIFSNFIARITGLFAKDATLVKKYKKQILAKGSAIDNMEVKFAKVKEDPISFNIGTVSTLGALEYNSEKSEMLKANYSKDGFEAEDSKEYAEGLHEKFFYDQETDKLSTFELSGAKLVAWMEGYTKKLADIKKKITKFESDTAKLVREAEKKSTAAAKAVSSEDDSTTKAVDDANQTYEAALAYQEAMLWRNKCLLNEISFEYKQYKAAFMKAVTVNKDKLKESAEYGDIVAEAAAQEVEDVISGAISKEELSQFNAASKNVLDGDTTDDPFANEYDKCSYYSTSPDYKVDGSIDTKINSKVNEAAEFGAPLWN